MRLLLEMYRRQLNNDAAHTPTALDPVSAHAQNGSDVIWLLGRQVAYVQNTLMYV